MKLVPAHGGFPRSDWTTGAQARLPVAEMPLAFGEARRVSEQAGHGMTHAAPVFDAFAEDHVAAALAVHRARLREAREGAPKISRSSQRAGMQFRITAGQPADIAALRRGLVVERRKDRNLRTRFAPGSDQMRIDESECRVRRARNALARRRQR